MPAAIQIKGLTKRYSQSGQDTITVFEDLNLEIEAERTTCILGPSGCGKTTLLNIMAGLDVPDEGAVKFDSAVAPDSKRAIGYMFQRDRLLPWRTALQNATLGVEVTNGKAYNRSLEAVSILGQFGLGGFENAFPSELSDGMRQRVAFVRTLLVRRKILLLDEPFAGVDYEVKLSLENELLCRKENEKTTVVFVSHDLETAIVVGDRIVTFSPRPARIKRIYEIHLPQSPREALAARQTQEFRQYLARLASDVLANT